VFQYAHTHTLFHAIGPLQVGRELYEKKKKGKMKRGPIPSLLLLLLFV
jgi:hypothetical protein